MSTNHDRVYTDADDDSCTNGAAAKASADSRRRADADPTDAAWASVQEMLGAADDRRPSVAYVSLAHKIDAPGAAGSGFPSVPRPRRGSGSGPAGSPVPGSGSAVPGSGSAVPDAVPGSGSPVPGSGSPVPGSGSLVPRPVPDAVPGSGSAVSDAVPGSGSPVPDGGSDARSGTDVELSGRSLPEDEEPGSAALRTAGGAVVRGASRVVNVRTGWRALSATSRGLARWSHAVADYRTGVDIAVLNEDPDNHGARIQFSNRIIFRKRLVWGEAFVVSSAAGWAGVYDPWLLGGAGATALLAAMVSGRGGRPIIADTPRLLAGPQALIPQSGVIQQALADANLGSKDPEDYTLMSPVIEDGPGWSVRIRLPRGVPFIKVAGRASEMAASLYVASTWIYVEAVDGDDSQMLLWVAKSDALGETFHSPLIGAVNGLDLWENGIPIGLDARRRKRHPRVVDASILVGGATRSGKTVLMISIALAAALDVRARFRIFDGKAGGDWNVLGRFAATFVKEDPARLVATLRALEAERRRRAALLDRLQLDKMNRHVYEQLFPLEFLFIDELHAYTGHDRWGKEIKKLLVPLASMGAAVGILVVAGTQTPNTDVIPTMISNNMQIRIAFRCMTSAASNAVLGSGRAGEGFNAKDIPIRRRGQAWMDADGDAPDRIKAYYADDEEKQAIAAMARALREKAGVLPNQERDPVEQLLLAATGVSAAAGGLNSDGRLRPTDPDLVDAPDLSGFADPEQEAPQLITHMAQVMAGDNLWTWEIISLLKKGWPDLYGNLTAVSLAKQVSPWLPAAKGIARPGENGGKRKNNNGYMWQWVVEWMPDQDALDPDFETEVEDELDAELEGAV